MTRNCPRPRGEGQRGHSDHGTGRRRTRPAPCRGCGRRSSTSSAPASGCAAAPVVLLTTIGARTGLAPQDAAHAGHARRGLRGGRLDERDRTGTRHWYANVLARPPGHPARRGPGPVPGRPGGDRAPSAAGGGRGPAGCSRRYVEYQSRTRRRIPLLLLEPRTQPSARPMRAARHGGLGTRRRLVGAHVVGAPRSRARSSASPPDSTPPARACTSALPSAVASTGPATTGSPRRRR